jgi:outer membrane protein TolC
MKKTIVLTLLTLSYWSSHGQNQPTQQLSAAQAVDYAMKHAVQVRNALLDVKIQKQVNNEVIAAALPRISASGSVNHFPDIAVQSFPNFIAQATYGVLEHEGVLDGNGNPIIAPADFGYVQARFGTSYNASGGVDISQLLFDGQVFIGLQARRSTLQFSQQQLEVTKEMIKVNVLKIYYQLVVGEKQLSSIEANIDRFEKLLADTREIYKNGFAEKLDVDKVSVQLNNLKTEKIKIQNALAAGNAGLKFLLNMPQQESLVLTDSITPALIKEDILTDKYQYTDRKEFQLLMTAKKLGKYNVQRYQLSYLPSIAAYGNYYKNAQRNQFDVFQHGPWFTSTLIGVKVSMPIFEGFAKRSRIEKAKLELQKTNNSIENLKASIDYEVSQASLKLSASLLTIDNQMSNMELAEKVYNTTKLKYEQGLGSNQEIYNAQTELKVAQNNYYGALYDAIIAKIDYLKATGKLSL